jgi:hypothetical protein
MDVKGAKALSERLADASRNVDLPPSKAVNSVAAADSASEDADTTAKGKRESVILPRPAKPHPGGPQVSWPPRIYLAGELTPGGGAAAG